MLRRFIKTVIENITEYVATYHLTRVEYPQLPKSYYKLPQPEGGQTPIEGEDEEETEV